VRAAAVEAAEGASRATEPVEVVGVGSRKDAVINFCLGSRTLSSTPIRFWYGTDTEFVNRGLSGVYATPSWCVRDIRFRGLLICRIEAPAGRIDQLPKLI
jgi:hypothetical protein